jgi:hypothetical protein
MEISTGPPTDHLGPPTDHLGPPTDHLGPPTDHLGPPTDQRLGLKLVEIEVFVALSRY